MKSDLSFGLRKKIAESKQEQLEQAVLAAAPLQPEAQPTFAPPSGYAVRMDTGHYVGIWRERETAETVCAKQPSGHNDRVIPMWDAQPAEDEATQEYAALYKWLRSSMRIGTWKVSRWISAGRYQCVGSENLMDRTIREAIAQQNTTDTPDSRKVTAQNQPGEPS